MNIININHIKKSIILFLLISMTRISIEEMIYNGAANIFHVDFHKGPFIRLLEFYMGMLLIPSFFGIKDYLEKNKNKFCLKLIFTIIQILSPIFGYYIMLKFNNKIHRCYFVVIFSIFIFIIGYDYGFLSYIFAKKFFIKVMSCQMEMFLMQKTMNNIIRSMKKKLKLQINLNQEIIFLIKVLIIFVTGYSYKILLKEKFARVMDTITSCLIKCLK